MSIWLLLWLTSATLWNTTTLCGFSQLMLEKQYAEMYPGMPFPPPAKKWCLLDEVRFLVEKIESSVLYIKAWSVKQNFKLDFSKLETLRQKDRQPNHPVRLVEPYLVPFVPL